MISLTSLLYADVAGAALLALWTIARWRRRPRTVPGALGLVIAALSVAQVGPTFIPSLMRTADATYVVLLGCVLPIFFFMFLTSGWLLLAILATGGSGGGGHRLPHASRN